MSYIENISKNDSDSVNCINILKNNTNTSNNILYTNYPNNKNKSKSVPDNCITKCKSVLLSSSINDDKIGDQNNTKNIVDEKNNSTNKNKEDNLFIQENNFINTSENSNITLINEKDDSIIYDRSTNVYSEFKYSQSNILLGENNKGEKIGISLKSKNILNENKTALNKNCYKNNSCFSTVFKNQLREPNEIINKKKNISFDFNILNNENCNNYMTSSEYNQLNNNVNVNFDKKKKTNENVNENDETERSKMNTLTYFFNNYTTSNKKKKIDNFSLNPNESINISLPQNNKLNYINANKENNYNKFNEKNHSDTLNSSTNILNFNSEDNEKNYTNKNKNYTNIFFHTNTGDFSDNIKKNEFSIFNIENHTENDSTKKQTLSKNKDIYINKKNNNLCVNKYNTMNNSENNNNNILDEKKSNYNTNYGIYNDERKNHISNNIDNYSMDINDMNDINNFINMENGITLNNTNINNINNINVNHYTDNRSTYDKNELELNKDNKDVNRYINNNFDFMHYINNHRDINYYNSEKEKNIHFPLNNKQINFENKNNMSINFNNIFSCNQCDNDTMKSYIHTSQIENPIIENNSKHNIVNNNINNFRNSSSNILDYFSNNEKNCQNFESIYNDLDGKNMNQHKNNFDFKKYMINNIKNDNLINNMIDLNNHNTLNEINMDIRDISEINNINHINETQNVNNESVVKDINIINNACKSNNVNEINCINNIKNSSNSNRINQINYINNLSYIKDNNINEIKNVDNITNDLNGIITLNYLDDENDIGDLNNVNNSCINNINYVDNVNIINNMNNSCINDVNLIYKTKKINYKNSNEMNNDVKYCNVTNVSNLNINNKISNCTNSYNKNLFQDMKCENDDIDINKSVIKESIPFNNHTKWLKFFTKQRNKTDFEENINRNESCNKNIESDKKENCLHFYNSENKKLLNYCNNIKLEYRNSDFLLNNWNDNIEDMKNSAKEEFIIKDNNENLLNVKNNIMNKEELQIENKDLQNDNIKVNENLSLDIYKEKTLLKVKDDKTNNFNEINVVNFTQDKKELLQINEVKNFLDNTNDKTNNNIISKEKNICNDTFNFHINTNTKNNDNLNRKKMEDICKWSSNENIFERNLYFSEDYSSENQKLDFKLMSKETINKNSSGYLNNMIKFKCDNNENSINKNVEMKKVNEYFYNIDNNNSKGNNNNYSHNNNDNCVDDSNKNVFIDNINNIKDNNSNIDKIHSNYNNSITDINKNNNDNNNYINIRDYTDINNIDINNNYTADSSNQKETQINNDNDDINFNGYSTIKKHNENKNANFSFNNNFNNIKTFCKNIEINDHSIINNGNYCYDNINNINISYNKNINSIQKSSHCNREDNINDICTTYDKLKEEVNVLYCNGNTEKGNMNTNTSDDIIKNEENGEKKIKTKDISYDLRNNYKWNYLEVNYPKNINFKKAFFFSYKNNIYIYGAKQNNFIIPDKIFKVNKNEIETICTKGAQPQIYFKIYFLCDASDNSLWDFKSIKNNTNDNLCVYNSEETREEKNSYENNLLSLIYKNEKFSLSDQQNYDKDSNSYINLKEEFNNEYNKKKKYFYVLGCKEQRIVDFYTIYKLDMSNFYWEEIKITYNRLLNLSREDFSIILINNYLYLFGGVILSNDKWVSCNEFWICNINKRKWKLLKLNKKKRKESDIYSNLNTSNSLKYLINLKKLNGDQNASNYQIENENKDEMNNENENNSPSSINGNKNFIEKWPTSRACHLCVCYNNKIFIHGGTDLIEEKDDFYFFDLKKKKWYEIICNTQNYPSKRYGHSGFFIKNKLYIYGGFTKYMNYGVLNNDFFEYDFEKNSWKQIFTIDDLLYLKIDLIKKKKSYLKFLQLLILKNYYKCQLVSCLNLNIDHCDKNTIDDEVNFKENISNNNNNNNKTELNTFLVNDTKINDDEKKNEYIKILNEKESYEKNFFESYSPNSDTLIKNNIPFHEGATTSKTNSHNFHLLNNYLYPNNLNKTKELDTFIKNSKLQRNLYCNFLCIEEIEFWKNIIIPYNNFRNRCLYFNNSLYFFGGCGLNNNSTEYSCNNFIYYDNILKIQIEKSYTDFILHYLFCVDNFFFKFIENLKINILKNIGTNKKNEKEYIDEESNTSYKTNATNKKYDVDICNYQKKNDENTYDEIYMNIKNIDNELYNTYMSIQQKDNVYNHKNEGNTCKNQMTELNDTETKIYTEVKNIPKMENEKLENMFLSVQKKKIYKLLIFLFDLYENIYSKNIIPEKHDDKNDNIKIHSQNDLCKDLYEKTFMEQNKLSCNHSYDMLTERIDMKIKINGDNLLEEVESDESLFMQTCKIEDNQDKNIYQKTKEPEIENYNKCESSVKNIYDNKWIQYSNEIKFYQNENKRDNLLANNIFNSIEINNQNINLNVNNNMGNDINYYENRNENYNESLNIASSENYKTNYNEIHNENYNTNSYYNDNEDNNYNLSKSYDKHINEVLCTNDLSLNEYNIKNNNIIKNYENIDLSKIKEINDLKENINFNSFEMGNIYNNNICHNMNRSVVFGHDRKHCNYDKEFITKNNSTYYDRSDIESRRMYNEEKNCQDFYNCYKSDENNYIIQKYLNNSHINLNIDKSIIYNYLENFHDLNDEKYAIKMKIKRNDIYKLIYTYTKNVEIENNIYFKKIEKLEAQVKDLLEEKNPIDKNNRIMEAKSIEYPFNEVHFNKLKNEVTYLKKKLNYFYDIINTYSVKLQKQNLYIKILENKYEYLMDYLLKFKSILFKECINNDICKFFCEDNFFIHEKNSVCIENNKNVTFNNNKIAENFNFNFNEVDYINHT
ncbi:conserved Plasmodium protein, unknown function [Plasmodium gallinaceum]|uniref:Kelch protein n=1 Tax=Plasmodium gallinaceum TaxID=5849 RepID=A0A1J1GVT0_PLAGA|nr:conserved Plasmodium protein, unknown function [Plasmodium gallinaceum]CRG96366.1 conserved Plasmodium protein, unknown function [Plasmodium gallinaceum]